VRPGLSAAERARELERERESTLRQDAPAKIPPKSSLRLRSLALVLGSALLTFALWLGFRSVTQPAEPATRGVQAITPTASTDCEPGTKACGRRCVSTELPEYGCAASNCQPCTLDHATPRCNAEGSCDVAICYKNFENCDGDSNNGCEADLLTSPEHCGACGRVCPKPPHATPGCGDTCTVWRCEPGYRDCNGRESDGCEVRVNEDPKNCGHCGATCARGKKCVEGGCQL
jgi:hypothetical protein